MTIDVVRRRWRKQGMKGLCQQCAAAGKQPNLKKGKPKLFLGLASGGRGLI
jgi:hypothetical protein